MKRKQISPLILPHNSLPPCSFHRLVPSFSLRVSARPRFRGTTHSISLQSSGTVAACSAQGPRQGAPHGGPVNDNPAKFSSPLGLIHQSNQVQHNYRRSFKSAHLLVENISKFFFCPFYSHFNSYNYNKLFYINHSLHIFSFAQICDTILNIFMHLQMNFGCLVFF